MTDKKTRESSYKPLLFTTTMRNPERIKPFLAVLNEYNEQILTNELIKEIFITLIRRGLYCPTRGVTDTIKNKWRDEVELSHNEGLSLYNKNPQEHKERGFDRGWPSRFQTSFQFAMELGLVYFRIDEPIKVSESGVLLLNDDLSYEQVVFANAFAKYQRSNPFKRVKNDNVPLILLLETIKLLKANDPASAGISKKEIPLLLCWPDNNAAALRDTILLLRKKYKFTPSDEVILVECKKLINTTQRDESSLLTDYPDEFIRKMKLTGLISLRGFGRFIDINSNENDAIDYILKTYSRYKKFDNENAFFNYISIIDPTLKRLLQKEVGIRTSSDILYKWVEHYGWDKIKIELLKLGDNAKSTDDILKFIEQPLRLEFLTSLAILANIKDIEVIPNYISDDEGLPSSHAPGNNADIECKESGGVGLVEVTLLTGVQQHVRESLSITRHLSDHIGRGNNNAYTLFVSPKLHKDTFRYLKFIKHDERLDVKALDIKDFVNLLERNTTLRDTAFTDMEYFA